MATLPTNLKDDILDASVNQRRRYNMITNPDGTVEFEDVTVYSQVGSEYGAGLINETNKQINGKVDDSKIVRDLKTIGAMTQEGFIPDALALKEVNDSLGVLFISKENYVSVNQTVSHNSSYTAPVTGMYSLNCKSADGMSAVWYMDTERTMPILASDALATTLVPLKAGETIYTRNVENTTYFVNGYFS